MKLFSEKHRFTKTFGALSVAALMAFSSLSSVTAATSVASESKEEKAAVGNVKRSIYMVTIDVNGKKNLVAYDGGTVADFLTENNIKVGDNQIVLPTLNTAIENDAVVYVRNAKPVKVTDGGETKVLVLAYGTVEESLAMAGIPLGEEDTTDAKRDAQIEKLSKLTIHRVTYQEKTETVKVAFEKEKKNDDKMELGETKIGTKGVDGEKQVVKRTKYVDGKKVEEKVVSEKVTKKPVNEVTLVGTKGAANTGTAGTFTDSNGVKVAYKELLTGSGTAYTAPAGSSTATGAPAHFGGVAIDPTVIPYGSKLYVESCDGSIVYGYCTAIDTGGFADDGSGIIDVFYDTYDECVNWGRRDVNVYVIE